MKLEKFNFNIKDNTSEDLFNEIYTLYNSKVYNLAFRMTGNEDVSEDITQETFIQIFTNFSNFRGESQIFTWIYTIVKNICLRYLDKNKRKSFHSIEKIIEKANLAKSFEKYNEQEKRFYITQIKDGCLLGLLLSLSFNQRIAFILNVLYDISINDVSNIINKSENSTRILIHRARKNLKEFLCNNCSLFNEDNNCKCENLISFSLEKDWIKKYNPAIAPEVIESEIKAFKNEITLYKTISIKNTSNDLKEKILAIIKEHKYNIFLKQKVK